MTTNIAAPKWGVFAKYKKNLANLIGGQILSNIPRGIFQGLVYFFILRLTLPVLSGAKPDISGLMQIYGWYVGIFFLYMLLSIWSETNAYIKAYTISTCIRLELGEKLRRLSLGFFKSHDPGDVTTRMLGDVTKAELTLSNNLSNIISAAIMPLMLGSFLIGMNAVLGGVLVGTVLFSSIFFFMAKQIVVRLGESHIEAVTRTSSRILEYVRCIKLLKAYDMTGKSFKTLDTAMLDLKNRSFKIEVTAGIPVQLFLLILDAGYFLMIYIAVMMLAKGTLDIPVLFCFVVLGHYFIIPVKQLGINLVDLHYSLLSTNRICDVMNTPEPVFDPDQTQPLAETCGIDFHNVHFSYPDKEVLKGIECHIPPNCMTALVGLSGSGKTTMTSLMARFWDVTAGEIRIGDVPVNSIEPDRLLKKISMVFQDVYLFNDTVRENIRIGKPGATVEEIEAAAKAACCHDFISRMPNGYNSIIGEAGNTLSGGEKQRISIARAILKNAPVVLLDEATASLDPENEADIQTAIENLVKGRTVIVIAHRFRSIINADQILVIDDGLIMDKGTHTQLAARDGLYKDLWEKQQRAGSWKLRA